MADERAGVLLDKLASLTAPEERVVVGLSSGTSFDGIDAALVRLRGWGDSVDAELLHFVCVPYESSLRSRIAAAALSDVQELARLNMDIGRAFAGAASVLAETSGVNLRDVSLIGSHGQTVYHESASTGGYGVTLQIGEADMIARSTGVVTVSDFRPADIAAGGSGAPLVPLVDWLLFRRTGEASVLLNIGGIANVTYVVEDLSGVRAFDTGPGNALLDEIIRAATGDDDAIDEDGKIASTGTAIPEAVSRFLARPYFSLSPPKSTGRETFGGDAARELAELVRPGKDMRSLAGGELADLLATAARITAQSIYEAMRFLPEAPAPGRVVVSGGGARNRAVVGLLEDLFSPCPVVGLAELGMDPDAKEAVAFAVLADRTLAGLPGNVLGATGARAPVVLGKISTGL